MCIFCRNQEKEKTMKKSQIINYLKLISDELTDAYHLTDTDSTVDANSYVSTAQELVDELMDNLQGKFDNRPLTQEEMNMGNIGPDGLPLVHIEGGQYFTGDGEGRLKGKN